MCDGSESETHTSGGARSRRAGHTKRGGWIENQIQCITNSFFVNKNADPSAKTAEGTELVGDLCPRTSQEFNPVLSPFRGRNGGEMESDGWLVG